MKSTTNNKTTIVEIIVATMIVMMLSTLFYYCIPEANAANQPTQKKQSEWVETNIIELPQGLEIFSGITRNGNPKYWFVIEDTKVFISSTNKEHYINNTCTILLVEWYNKSIDRYKYTTKQKKEDKQPKRINLKNI